MPVSYSDWCTKRTSQNTIHSTPTLTAGNTNELKKLPKKDMFKEKSTKYESSIPPILPADKDLLALYPQREGQSMQSSTISATTAGSNEVGATEWHAEHSVASSLSVKSQQEKPLNDQGWMIDDERIGSTRNISYSKHPHEYDFVEDNMNSSDSDVVHYAAEVYTGVPVPAVERAPPPLHLSRIGKIKGSWRERKSKSAPYHHTCEDGGAGAGLSWLLLFCLFRWPLSFRRRKWANTTCSPMPTSQEVKVLVNRPPSPFHAPCNNRSNELKVVFLGAPESGKTTLIEALSGKTSHRQGAKSKTLKVSFWQPGGSECEPKRRFNLWDLKINHGDHPAGPVSLPVSIERMSALLFSLSIVF